MQSTTTKRAVVLAGRLVLIPDQRYGCCQDRISETGYLDLGLDEESDAGAEFSCARGPPLRVDRAPTLVLQVIGRLRGQRLALGGNEQQGERCGDATLSGTGSGGCICHLLGLPLL